VDEAKKVLKRMANFNGKGTQTVEYDNRMDKLVERMKSVNSTEERKNTNLPDLFRGPNLRRKTLIVTLIFIAGTVPLYYNSFNMENLEAPNFYFKRGRSNP